MRSGPDSSLIWFGMFAMSCALAFAGTVAASKAALCGPPLTMIHLMPSPALMVMFAGTNLYSLFSRTMRTSCVVPVIGAAVPAGVGVVAGVVAAAAAAVSPVVAVLVLSAPPHASAIMPAAPKRILVICIAEKASARAL